MPNTPPFYASLLLARVLDTMELVSASINDVLSLKLSCKVQLIRLILIRNWIRYKTRNPTSTLLESPKMLSDFQSEQSEQYWLSYSTLKENIVFLIDL